MLGVRYLGPDFSQVAIGRLMPSLAQGPLGNGGLGGRGRQHAYVHMRTGPQALLVTRSQPGQQTAEQGGGRRAAQQSSTTHLLHGGKSVEGKMGRGGKLKPPR